MSALRRLPQLFSSNINNISCLKQTQQIYQPLSTILEARGLSINLNRDKSFYRRTHVPWIKPQPNGQSFVEPEPTNAELAIQKDVTAEINSQIEKNRTDRLFAVVQVAGKQFKVTENDIIIIQGYWPPTSGDKLNLEKVLLVGGKDFSLIGRPLLNRELVSVDATVIEKTFSPTKFMFYFKQRKQYRRTRFLRVQLTMLRINSIKINGKVDEKKAVEGLDRIF